MPGNPVPEFRGAEAGVQPLVGGFWWFGFGLDTSNKREADGQARPKSSFNLFVSLIGSIVGPKS